MSNIDTVKQIYAAFGRGDIRAILDTLDDNVEWDVEVPVPGVPWLQPRRGKTNIPRSSRAWPPCTLRRSSRTPFSRMGSASWPWSA